MLISCVGADDDATQSDPDYNNTSDEGSELSLDDDARSSTDGSVGPRRPTIERSERVIKEETPAPALDPAPEALDSRFVSYGWAFLRNPKRSREFLQHGLPLRRIDSRGPISDYNVRSMDGI